MEPYFTIDVVPPTSSGPNQIVEVTVTSNNGAKGTVGIGYTTDPSDAPTNPLYVDPTSDSVYVPKGGSATTSVTVGLSAGNSVTLTASISDSSASCVVSN